MYLTISSMGWSLMQRLPRNRAVEHVLEERRGYPPLSCCSTRRDGDVEGDHVGLQAARLARPEQDQCVLPPPLGRARGDRDVERHDVRPQAPARERVAQQDPDCNFPAAILPGGCVQRPVEHALSLALDFRVFVRPSRSRLSASDDVVFRAFTFSLMPAKDGSLLVTLTSLLDLVSGSTPTMQEPMCL